jgi:hypothetical protein
MKKIYIFTLALAVGFSSFAFVANAQTTRICTANDLEGSSTLIQNASFVTGYVTLKNRSQSTCIVSNPHITLQTKTEFLPVVKAATKNFSLTLRPGEKARVTFNWTNYCSTLLSSVYVRLSVTGDTGYLQIPAMTAMGNPQTITPQCLARTMPSWLYTLSLVKM